MILNRPIGSGARVTQGRARQGEPPPDVRSAYARRMRELGLSPVVSYAVDEGTVVRFEIDPTQEWGDASPGGARVIEQVKAAVGPALLGAKAVLEQARAMGPDEVTITFGIKVSGTATWVVAKAATEGNFEIALTWKAKHPADGGGDG